MTKKLTTDEFIRKAKEVHGDKYDYSKVEYINAKTKVLIICPVHGEFWQSPDSHLRGHKCDKCGGSCDIPKEEFIKRAINVHSKKYDYSEIEYINLSHHIYIKCPIHGMFRVTPENHIRGRGCPECGITKRKRKICGIGINDYSGRVIIDNKAILSYQTWKDMIIRCYGNKKNGYKDCKVCDEWLKFSNFKRWFDENYIEGYVLDKDIINFGNKEYSPKNCIFVPKDINIVFKTSKEYGIHETEYGTFSATYNHKRIGTFCNKRDAIIALSDYFINRVKDKAKHYLSLGMISPILLKRMVEYAYSRKKFLLDRIYDEAGIMPKIASKGIKIELNKEEF